MPIARLVTLAAIPAIAAACSARAGPPALAAAGEHGPVIEVENRNLQGMEVTFDVGGQAYRLGDVPALGMARFTLPAEVPGAAARITLKATGDLTVFRTSLVRYSGVEDLRLVIAANPRQSALVVRE